MSSCHVAYAFAFDASALPEEALRKARVGGVSCGKACLKECGDALLGIVGKVGSRNGLKNKTQKGKRS